MTIVVKALAKKEITCYNCKSVLEYDQSDVKKYTTNHDYLGDYDTVFGIKCPVCDSILKDK